MCHLIFLLLLMANIVPICLLDVVVKQCYDGQGTESSHYGKCYPYDGCYKIDCKSVHGDGPMPYHLGCGTCSNSEPQHYIEQGCKCDNCTGDLCNEIPNKGVKNCYVGDPDKFSGNYEKGKCDFFNNDGCNTKVCNDGNGPGDYEKGCGKCPPAAPKRDGRSIENGPQFGGPGTGGNGDPFPEYGRDEPPIDVPKGSGSGNCKCTDCKGDFCNGEAPKSKGSIKKCYVDVDENLPTSKIGKFKEGNCSIFNNDGCRTFDCGGGEEHRSCGKCPEKQEDYPPRFKDCECKHCDGDMCNKEVFVDKCYWGDDLKGYEALECDPDNHKNKGCKKVSCLSSINEGRDGTIKRNKGIVSRDCGKCPKGGIFGCKCFDCNDGDLCNGGLGMRIGSTTFLLAMIGGIIALLAMKLEGIGI